MKQSPAEPPSQGLVGGKYELVRMIGRGGMGSVWEARHASLGTPSAIKFIEAEYADSHEARSRFDKEAKAAATIQSKHAIQIYDHGVTDDGKPYIVMELLVGEPLDKVIDRGPMPLHEAAKILHQVCRGLARAHERGIIHRDLKPENIFLVKNQDDDEAIAKVLDFGIAKMQATGAAAPLTSSTKTGAVLGTPFYMSPEQARGLRNVDHRADIWSLGVIAFKCVTGKLPFDGESVGDLLVKICTAPLPVPSEVAAAAGVQGLPPNFDAVFMRALEREPDRRFATVTDFASALCFAAGVSFGPAPGTPISHVGSAPNHPGILTPHHGSSGNRTPHGSLPTPAPAALTNAPFTSESIPGVGSSSSGKSKLLLGGIAVVALVCGVAGVTYVLRRQPQADATNGALVSPPVSLVSAAPLPPPVPDRPLEPEPPAAAPAPPPPPPPPAAKAAARPGSATKTGATKPAAAPPPPPPPPATPPPQPPPSPPVVKKPNKNDPGY
jgi:serine/threonine-protein kinase